MYISRGYGYSSFVMLDDVLYPLLCSWCGIVSTVFVTEFCFEEFVDEHNFMKSY